MNRIKKAIRKRALISVKARLAEHSRSIDDLTDEELEIILYDEEKKIYDKLKTSSFFAVLAMLGINLF